MFVTDVMTREPVTVHVDTPLKEAAAILAENGITAVPVLDDDAHLCGVLSEADVLRDAFMPDPRAHLIPGHQDTLPPAVAVSEVMTAQVLSVHQSSDVSDAVDLMTSTGVKSLPVVDDHGRLVGVVSRSDLVKVRARSDHVIAHEVDSMLVSLGHTDWVVEVDEGAVTIEGPESPDDRTLAEIAAASVAGVISVRVG